jgi:hypothetical protein
MYKVGIKKQVPYSGPTILEYPVNLVVTWHFLLNAHELIHILIICKDRKTINYNDTTVKNIVA